MHAGRLPPGRAVDLGCGTGANAVFLAQHGFDVTGIDFAPAALAKASAKGHRRGRTYPVHRRRPDRPASPAGQLRPARRLRHSRRPFARQPRPLRRQHDPLAGPDARFLLVLPMAAPATGSLAALQADRAGRGGTALQSRIRHRTHRWHRHTPAASAHPRFRRIPDDPNPLNDTLSPGTRNPAPAVADERRRTEVNETRTETSGLRRCRLGPNPPVLESSRGRSDPPPTRSVIFLGSVGGC